jgi:hypothetical protein
MDEDEKAGFEVLCEAIPSDLAISVIKCRRKKKAAMTARIAKRLVSQYRAYGNPEEAAEIHITKSWIDFQSDWVKKEQRYTDPHHPTKRDETAEDRNRRLQLQNEYSWARNEGDTRRMEQVKALLSQAVKA